MCNKNAAVSERQTEKICVREKKGAHSMGGSSRWSKWRSRRESFSSDCARSARARLRSRSRALMSEQHLLLDVPASVGEQLHAWLAGNASADVRVAIPALTVSTTFTFDPKAFDGRQWTPTTSKAVSSMQQLPNTPGVQALVQELIAGKLEFTREQFNKFGTGMLPLRRWPSMAEPSSSQQTRRRSTTRSSSPSGRN